MQNLMRKLSAFIFITLDGYYKGLDEDISWHNHGEEKTQFSEEMLSLGNALVFGRRTYEMMASFWNSDMAHDMYPQVAIEMNRAEKIVFTSQPPPHKVWENTRFIAPHDSLNETIKHLLNNSKKDITILGSGEILRPLIEKNQINEYQIMIDPVILGSGYRLFEGTDHLVNLSLVESRTFSDGTIFLRYINR